MSAEWSHVHRAVLLTLIICYLLLDSLLFIQYYGITHSVIIFDPFVSSSLFVRFPFWECPDEMMTGFCRVQFKPAIREALIIYNSISLGLILAVFRASQDKIFSKKMRYLLLPLILMMSFFVAIDITGAVSFSINYF